VNVGLVLLVVVVALVVWFIYRAFGGSSSGTPDRNYSNDYYDQSFSTSVGNWFSNLFTSSSSSSTDDYYDTSNSSGSSSSDSGSSDSGSSDSGGSSSDS
jgi:hypothetical protein